MRILWVNPSFLDYRVPVYKRLYELTNGDFYIVFSEKRVPERVIKKMKDAIGENAIVYKGEKVLELWNRKGMNHKYLGIPFTFGLYKLIKNVNADIVIAEGFFQWTPKAVYYSFWHKKPLLIAYERTKHTERFCPKWRLIYRQMIDKFATGYLCNGKLTKEYLMSIGVKKEKCFMGGMSADSKGLVCGISKMSEEQKKENELGIIGNGITYLYVGRMTECKGVIYLLRAWAKHKEKHQNDHLLLVGGGELLEEFIAEFGHERSIHFVGEINYDEIYKYYVVANIFVIPTLEDNWSLVVPEAMACGLPIACSIYNGCYPELCIEGENGVLFDPLKEETILEALDKFHHIDLNEYGKNSIEIEEEYNFEHVSKKIYDACLQTYIKTKKDNER